MATYSSALASNHESLGYLYSFAPENEPGDDEGSPASHEHDPAEHDELPYKVELWNAAKNGVEQVLAVTANASIGYAAYYAATREHPDRYVTLRHKNSFVSRWNGPAN
ncbi:hypothetical protein [Mesorhizobium captivum]|uniref:Uncharacterized protein n=1 Tax=Mesorhizobium captivum TaxID=3072319 RepID=A0ABU4YZI9_9HYPH|nr:MULTISPECIES: hypothetical protein [unclassified Mesorhizobium]MDX8491768.1 hypothetical protein [Mesorhizobium sp. VK22B]MDX8505079.1 hypothetical protein [Mesorhizobium sp. VK22E]MDX8512593.1 hypothetical protein [Mesorhizobium sp. VK23E]